MPQYNYQDKCFLVRASWGGGGKREREEMNVLLTSNQYSEQNLLVKLEIEIIKLSFISSDIFSLTAMKTLLLVIQF